MRRLAPSGALADRRRVVGKGQVESALMGPLRLSCFSDRGTFWVLPLTYFHIPRSVSANLFVQSVKIHYFFSGPVSVDPICPQPSRVGEPQGPGWPEADGNVMSCNVM